MEINLFNDYEIFNKVFNELLKVDEGKVTPEEAEEVIKKYLANVKVNCMKIRMIRYQARISLDYKLAYDAVVQSIIEELVKIFKSVSNPPPIDVNKESEINKLRKLLYNILNDLFQCVIMTVGSPKKIWEYVEDPRKRKLLDEICVFPTLVNYIYPSYKDGFKRLTLTLYILLAVIFYANRKCLEDVNVHEMRLAELLPLLAITLEGR
ncbi:hypothetical protein EYM_00690 [Ignicoccus islandicus DSM 13165]|uniref:Uncharacterized protein n=1 Tax=Ignicoccus islandicus DSM 13165 TaxID=940295 RepID=A0A0U3FJR2_9CREN|nr:hypothetical protein [Ignicoccus islandicus]ALU12134.1 hypothetical protein EYM_00690 [Ignicoccus islandicus DSM 13165]